MEPANDDAGGMMYLELFLPLFLYASRKETAMYSRSGGSGGRGWFGAFGKDG